MNQRFEIVEATIDGIHARMRAGTLTSRELVEGYLARIAHYDRQGPEINSIVTINPAALEAFMTEPPFAGATPVFLGDDLTDEDAFRAADALGGYGVVVGPRRPSAARYALANVAAARAWLGAAVERSAP